MCVGELAFRRCAGVCFWEEEQNRKAWLTLSRMACVSNSTQWSFPFSPFRLSHCRLRNREPCFCCMVTMIWSMTQDRSRFVLHWSNSFAKLAITRRNKRLPKCPVGPLLFLLPHKTSILVVVVVLVVVVASRLPSLIMISMSTKVWWSSLNKKQRFCGVLERELPNRIASDHRVASHSQSFVRFVVFRGSIESHFMFQYAEVRQFLFCGLNQ